MPTNYIEKYKVYIRSQLPPFGWDLYCGGLFEHEAKDVKERLEQRNIECKIEKDVRM